MAGNKPGVVFYKKACPLTMLKIGDWTQYRRDDKICGFLTLCRGDNRLGIALEKRGVSIDFYPEVGKRVIAFHNTPISVIASILPLNCVRKVEMQVLMQVKAG